MPLRPSYSILKNLHFTLKIDRPTEWFLSVDAVDIWRELLRLGKSIDIFRNSRWCQRHLGFLENYYFWPKRSILVGARCMLLKCGENCFILEETINFFEIQDGGRRRLGFWKICTFNRKYRYCLLSGVCGWNLIRIASNLRKLLTFIEIQDAGRRQLGLWKICNFGQTHRLWLVPDVRCWNLVRIA